MMGRCIIPVNSLSTLSYALIVMVFGSNVGLEYPKCLINVRVHMLRANPLSIRTHFTLCLVMKAST